MGRTTAYHSLVTPEKWEKVNTENKGLLSDFIDFCQTQDRSAQTMYQYESQIKIALVWIAEKCDNKCFCSVKKREWVRFFGYLRNDLGSSSNRISSIKSALSSFSNYIENILDDEYEYHNIIKNVPIPAKEETREKTILTKEEIDACLNSLLEKGKIQVACFLALLVASGMRKAEALQIKVSDFDDANLALQKQFYCTHPIRTKGKGAKGKVLRKYVDATFFKPYFDKLMEWRKEQGIQSEFLFVIYHEGNYEPAKISTANSWSAQIEAVLGRPFYAHACRHFWTGFSLKDKNYSEEVVRQLQGWQSNEMVQHYFDYSSEEQLEDTFARLFAETDKKENEDGTN